MACINEKKLQKDNFYYYNYFFYMFAEFYSKGSPLVSKETSLGRNQYLTSRGREVMGYWGEGSIYRGMVVKGGWV